MWMRGLLGFGLCSFVLAVLAVSANSMPCDLETLVAPEFNDWRQAGSWVQSFSVKQCKYVI